MWQTRTLPFRGVRQGMNATSYATELAPHQCARIRNFHLAKEGVLVSRGGSLRISDTALASAIKGGHGFYKHNTNGTVTRYTLAKSGTTLYQFNTSTLVFDAIAGTPTMGTAKPCMVNFLNGSGAECVVYCDGTAFFMWDGTTVTSLMTPWQAAGFTNAPRYLCVYADALFAAGDSYNPSLVAYSADLDPTYWGSTAVFYVDPGDGYQIRGLCAWYENLAIAKERSISLVTGKDRTQFAKFRISPSIGAFSHWGMKGGGHHLYFNDDANIYLGTLRALAEDGLEVNSIGDSMATRYDTKAEGSAYEMTCMHMPADEELMWTVMSGDSTTYDELYVYSLKHSSPDIGQGPQGVDVRYVWAGVWTGLDVHSVAMIEDANGALVCHAFGADGYVAQLNNGYKDNRAVGATTGTDITFEIHHGEIFLLSSANNARVRRIFPALYQKYNGTMTAEWIIDQSVRHPATPVAVKFTGNIPYWNDGNDPDIMSQWGSTIWKDRPFLRAAITVNEMAGTFQLILLNNDDGAQNECAFAGYAMTYQIKKARVRG